MKLSPKQKEDLETVIYFLPEGLRNIVFTENDIKLFFEYSEKGLNKELLEKDSDKIWLINKNCSEGFWALVQGKMWRGRMMQMYEEGVLDGSMPYIVLLGDYVKRKPSFFWKILRREYKYVINTPRSVVNFMKKEMFQGKDSEVIENLYQTLSQKK